MIDMIRERADWIQNELWKVASDCYGLERTNETLQLIERTYIAVLNAEAKAIGRDDFVMDAGLPSPANDDLDGLALAFMSAASAEYENDLCDALKMLVVAAEALGKVSVVGDLKKATGGAVSQDLTTFAASSLAKRRHAENYALIGDALKYWRENIDPTISASKAANELVRVVPLSHKKLAEVVAAEKKKLT